MNLASQLLDRIANPNLNRNERAMLRCQLSKVLEELGDYEAAREAMGEIWSKVGEPPKLNGLDQRTVAEVLLQVGVLTSCIGSAKQIEDAQEAAKNLISESIRTFEALNDTTKVAEAQTNLAICYWRQGAFEEARVLLQKALLLFTEEDRAQKAIALLRSAIVERSASRFNDALRIHVDAAPLFEKLNNHALKGKFHNGLAVTLRNLGAAEQREDYIDRALVEFAAASYHFEQAGHLRFQARVENNLGLLFSNIGKFAEAHEHLNRSRRIFAKLRESGSVGQTDETRARVLLAEGRNAEAEKVARGAVAAVEKGDEQSLLVEALTTHAVALTRVGKHTKARLTFQRAVVIAEQTGDLAAAGRATLSAVEELAEEMGPGELGELYERAAEILTGSQHPGISARLVGGARRVIRLLVARAAESGARVEDESVPFEWGGFSLKKEMRRHERRIIERALKDSGGIVSRAARLLGFKHYQSLISLINNRHQNLLNARSPVIPRRRSIMRAPQAPTKRAAASKKARRVAILFAEDDRAVAGVVRGLLEAEGWRVEACQNGLTALKKITGQGHYDLLLMDNALPGIGGLEIVRQARKLYHRRRTPIIMLSASDCETQAWGAGVDAFLKKPEDLQALTATITRLLNADND